jgi:hypothetical protein
MSSWSYFYLCVRHESDVLWALTGPNVYGLFVMGCRWQGPRFEEWLFETLRSRLFGSAPPGVR